MKERCRSSSISQAGDSNWPEPTTSTRAAIFARLQERGRRHRNQARQPQLPGAVDHRVSRKRTHTEKAMANHASTRTKQLYDRRRDEVSLDEVERMAI
jgi:hypothetical protein